MSGEESPALAKVDAFAMHVLSRLAPLAFGIARSPAELEAVYRLRYEVVMDQGWARPEDFPDGLERDAFDDRALQIVVWEGGELVGTTRLVAPEAGCRLPTEDAFDLEIASRGRVIDMGRTCRAPRRKDTGHRIIWGLLCQSWIELRRRGFAEICGIFSPGMNRFYQRLGFRIETLAEARPHWGEYRYPVLVRPAESIDAVRSRVNFWTPPAPPQNPGSL
jgi:N-acyl-L-homoserine lactone synthetase